MEYRQTQSGYIAVFVVVWFVLILLVVVLLSDGQEPGVVAAVAGALLFIAVVVFWFNRLSVIVRAEEVRVYFGPGWPRRSIATHNIIGFRQVRNKWWYGWGIRLIPGGWMYNVWGLDAIELDLANGKKFRIGTREPSELMAALSASTALRPG